MKTPVSVEDIIDTHIAALGLPPRPDDESTSDYATRIGASAITPGRKAETLRCLLEAGKAATIADHANTAFWLSQARQHLPTD